MLTSIYNDDILLTNFWKSIGHSKNNRYHYEMRNLKIRPYEVGQHQLVLICSTQ